MSSLTSPWKPSARNFAAPFSISSCLRKRTCVDTSGRARFAAATIGQLDRLAHQRVGDLDAGLRLHRRVARLVVHEARAGDAVEFDALLQQVLVDVEQSAAGEDLLELVLQQLIHAGAAGDDHCVDVEVVECVGDAVEEHAVVGGDLLPLVGLAGGDLRVAAAQVAGR